MKKLSAIWIFILITNIYPQEVLDKIVAVVDNEIILQSELQFETAIYASQRRLNPDDPKLKEQILNSLIDQKLLYAQAALDSINVSDDEIDAQLENLMNYYISQYGSQQRVEQAYGMSIDRIKRELRDDTKKQLMAQHVQQEKFGNVTVTRREVEDFFNTYKDSLGMISEKFRIAHIFINPSASDRLKNKAREFAQSILDSIKNGADFGEMAKKYSEDPGSASKGGDLGFVKRGVFYPEFESAAFALKEGEISKIVESPVGFHIIELLERKGESIHTRHILIKIKPDDQSDLQAIQFLSDIRDSIVSGVNTFAYYAKKYSDDIQTKNFGGELGIFEVTQLDKSILDQVYKLKEGEIGFPKRLDIDKNNYGFHIVKLISRTPEHLPDLNKDYDEIQKLAEYNKKQKLYVDWLKELRDKIYWEIRL